MENICNYLNGATFLIIDLVGVIVQISVYTGLYVI